jgi:hypothetical protein
MYVACTEYIRDKKVRPEIFPRACTWPVQPIYVIKKVGPEISPTACTWPVQPIYVMKYVAPEIFSRASNGLHILYMVQTGSGVHPTSYPMGTGGSFPGVNGRGLKMTTHFKLGPRSRKCRSVHPLPHTHSRLSAYLVKHWDNFTFLRHIRHEKIWSIDISYRNYVACRAYIRDENTWSRDFPYSIYLSCRA